MLCSYLQPLQISLPFLCVSDCVSLFTQCADGCGVLLQKERSLSPILLLFSPMYPCIFYVLHLRMSNQMNAGIKVGQWLHIGRCRLLVISNFRYYQSNILTDIVIKKKKHNKMEKFNKYTFFVKHFKYYNYAFLYFYFINIVFITYLLLLNPRCYSNICLSFLILTNRKTKKNCGTTLMILMKQPNKRVLKASRMLNLVLQIHSLYRPTQVA